MKDRLVVEYLAGSYRVAWFLAEEQNIGAILGEGAKSHGSKSVPPKGGEFEYWAAERALYVMDPRPGMDSHGYAFESKASAKAAIKVCNMAIAKKPVQPWAAEALALGWKPPK